MCQNYIKEAKEIEVVGKINEVPLEHMYKFLISKHISDNH